MTQNVACVSADKEGGEKRREGSSPDVCFQKALSPLCARALSLFPPGNTQPASRLPQAPPNPMAASGRRASFSSLPFSRRRPRLRGCVTGKEREKRREEDASLLSVWGVGKVCLTYYSSRLRRRLISNYASPLILFWASIEFPGGGR